MPSRARYPTRHLLDRGGLAAVPNALVFLAAAWLLLSATSFDHAGSAGRWNETVVGTVLAVVALTRVISPRSIPWLDWVSVALGGWLVVAPSSLDRVSSAAAVNDVIVIVIVIALALLSLMISWRSRSGKQFNASPGGGDRTT